MTLDEMTTAIMAATGCDRTKAEATARANLGMEATPNWPAPREVVTLPLSLTIPWSALVSDNRHYAPALRGGKPALILTEAYREAKAAIVALATSRALGRAPYVGPLSFTGLVWTPDKRRHDIANRSKAVHDAMSGILFADDSQLHEVHWILAGVDVDAPRAQITLEPET